MHANRQEENYLFQKIFAKCFLALKQSWWHFNNWKFRYWVWHLSSLHIKYHKIIWLFWALLNPLAKRPPTSCPATYRITKLIIKVLCCFLYERPNHFRKSESTKNRLQSFSKFVIKTSLLIYLFGIRKISLKSTKMVFHHLVQLIMFRLVSSLQHFFFFWNYMMITADELFTIGYE